MRSKVIRVGVAVVLALVGTVVLIRYVESARDEAVQGEGVVNVYIVNQDIPQGTSGSDVASKVSVEEVPSKVRAADAVTDLATISALTTNADLKDGEQLLSSRFTTAGAAARGAPAGSFTVTLSLDVERALGGQLRPGDYVQVLVTYPPGTATKSTDDTAIAVPRIYVAKVQGANVPAPDASATGGVTPAPTGAYLVTLSGSDDDVKAVVRAKENGKVWLAATPADATSTPASTGRPS